MWCGRASLSHWSCHSCEKLMCIRLHYIHLDAGGSRRDVAHTDLRSSFIGCSGLLCLICRCIALPDEFESYVLSCAASSRGHGRSTRSPSLEGAVARLKLCIGDQRHAVIVLAQVLDRVLSLLHPSMDSRLCGTLQFLGLGATYTITFFPCSPCTKA